MLFLTVNVFSEGKKDETRAILNVLEKEFRDIESISADFDQVKKMSLFKREIKLKGNLLIKFPHYFKWEVLEPVKTTVTADGKNIEIWDEETDSTQTLSIENNPVVKNIWSQIDSWFMGKYNLLSKDYNIKISEVDEKETSIPVLVFSPKSEKLSKVIKSVSLYFSEGDRATSEKKYLKKVILRENTGDSTVIKFKNVKISLLKK